LEHHHNCPTCRHSLIETTPAPQPPAPQQPPEPVDNVNNIHQHPGAVPPQNREEIFRFNGGRWFSWLPTIQVVSERRFYGQDITSVPQEMIQRVQEVFPHVPSNTIAEDLLRTNSVEITLENILEGRVEIQASENPTPPTFSNSTPISTANSTTPVTEIPRSRSDDYRSQMPTSTVFADTFGNTPQERQQRLQLRKQAIVEQARRQFIEKQLQEQQQQQPREPQKYSESSQEEQKQEFDGQASPLEDVEQRRRLFLEALSRRQQTKKDD